MLSRMQTGDDYILADEPPHLPEARRPDLYRPAPEADKIVRENRDGTIPGRYARGGRTNWGAMTAIIVLHVVLVGAMLTAHMTFERKAPPPPLKTFDLAPPPPPPAPETPPPPTEQVRHVDRISVPVPLVTAPTRSSVATTTEIAPVAPVVVKAPPGPAKTPMPAPVVPPDFSAAQLKNAGPAYPYLSRRAKEQGVVTLRVLVTEDGRAGEIRIDGSSGFERLDKAALDTVKRWKFLPAKQAGKAVAAWVLVPVTFALG